MHARVLTALILASAPAFAEDLTAVYPVDLPETEGDIYATDWTAGPEDVWRLSDFQYEIKDKLKIRLGRCQAVIGHDGTNAVWAFVVPDRPPKISTSFGGDGEKIEHVWVRFHPKRVGEIFPTKTVRGNGDPDLLYWAYRVYGFKAGDEYGAGNVTVIPPEDALVLDIDTLANTRRVYSIEMSKGKARYKSGYLTNTCPDLEETKKRDAVAIVEAAWQQMDSSYALFENSPEVDWSSALDDAKSDCAKAKSTFETAIAIRKMLDKLEDDDLWVFVGGELVTKNQFTVEQNASWSGVNYILGDTRPTDHGIVWTRTPQNVGYINFLNIGSEELLGELDELLETIGDTWAMIVDLRYTRIGQREIAEKIAGRFMAEDQIYGYMQKRSGAAHDDFAEAEALTCEARGPWTYEAPLYLVVGPGTFREGEQLALMLRRAGKVVTAGSPTRGFNSTGERLDIGNDVVIIAALGRDLDSEGAVIQGRGLQPDMLLEFDPSEFTDDNDPVLYKILEEVLKTPAHERLRGNRNKPSGEGEGGATTD